MEKKPERRRIALAGLALVRAGAVLGLAKPQPAPAAKPPKKRGFSASPGCASA